MKAVLTWNIKGKINNNNKEKNKNKEWTFLLLFPIVINKKQNFFSNGKSF